MFMLTIKYITTRYINVYIHLVIYLIYLIHLLDDKPKPEICPPFPLKLHQSET